MPRTSRTSPSASSLRPSRPQHARQLQHRIGVVRLELHGAPRQVLTPRRVHRQRRLRRHPQQQRAVARLAREVVHDRIDERRERGQPAGAVDGPRSPRRRGRAPGSSPPAGAAPARRTASRAPAARGCRARRPGRCARAPRAPGRRPHTTAIDASGTCGGDAAESASGSGSLRRAGPRVGGLVVAPGLELGLAQAQPHRRERRRAARRWRAGGRPVPGRRRARCR